MDRSKINSAVDSAFDSAFKNWSHQIEKELYPAAFADEYSWLRVKNSVKINNEFLKAALKEALAELFVS
mgnify:CR=1 FL=1